MKDDMNMDAVPGQETDSENGDAQAQEDKKTFTQDEVNRIMQKRLEQMKKQAAKEKELEYDAKLHELESREMNLAMKEELEKREMPKRFADVITCSNAEEMKQKLDVLQEILSETKKNKESGASKRKALYVPQNGTTSADGIREAMGLD